MRVFFGAVTGASRGYGFVEFETEREMLRAYKVVVCLHLCCVIIIVNNIMISGVLFVLLYILENCRLLIIMGDDVSGNAGCSSYLH